MTPQHNTRVRSLDAIRGLMLVTNVTSSSVLIGELQNTHHPWAGVHLVDLIFPIFVTLTGVGIAFAYSKGFKRPRRLVRRVLVLIAAGFVYGAITTNNWDPSTTRIFGVLQLYAVVILIVSLAHIWTRSWRSWAVIVVIATVTLTALDLYFMVRCEGALTPECNPSRTIDLRPQLLAHIYHQGASGHDPEGFVSIAGATLQASIGALFGHIILAARTSRRPVAFALGFGALITVATVVLGALINYWSFLGFDPLPAMKRLWTPPFALYTAAMAGIVVIVAFIVIDNGSDRRKTVLDRYLKPFFALGRNSLLVYFGSHLVNDALRELGLLAPLDVVPWAHLYPIFAVLTWTLLAMILDSRRIYLRA